MAYLDPGGQAVPGMFFWESAGGQALAESHLIPGPGLSFQPLLGMEGSVGRDGTCLLFTTGKQILSEAQGMKAKLIQVWLEKGASCSH